jgi:hypothetical protein
MIHLQTETWSEMASSPAVWVVMSGIPLNASVKCLSILSPLTGSFVPGLRTYFLAQRYRKRLRMCRPHVSRGPGRFGPSPNAELRPRAIARYIERWMHATCVSATLVSRRVRACVVRTLQ